MDTKKLPNKIRVVLNRRKAPIHPEKRLRFYKKYASIVSTTLRKPLFQRFLSWMIRKENIDKNSVNDIQVRVLPFQKVNGKPLAGRCNSEGVILLFPKKQRFLQKKVRDHGKDSVWFYIKSRARAALIHELLHVKYGRNEHKVRKLTMKYFDLFIRHRNISNQMMTELQKSLFTF